jgi:hypothetical protein
MIADCVKPGAIRVLTREGGLRIYDGFFVYLKAVGENHKDILFFMPFWGVAKPGR